MADPVENDRPIAGHWCGQTQPHDAHAWQTPPAYGAATFIQTYQCGGYVIPSAEKEPMPNVENGLPGIWGEFTRKCDRCGGTYGGSHYHCGGCDSLDVTGSYGHHSTFCKRTRSNREFHHCGPDGCELDTPIPSAEKGQDDA